MIGAMRASKQFKFPLSGKATIKLRMGGYLVATSLAYGLKRKTDDERAVDDGTQPDMLTKAVQDFEKAMPEDVSVTITGGGESGTIRGKGKKRGA